ncbi:glycosyl transferase family 2 [Solibacillus sp. R5-41]|uniref:glycosyltransferase n=1 Tax=Solibacillus sp. R5-41 TaxID=2048654 RepID=UPI000C1280C1|nr:glycosyltransferase [Solibacillus sp. R5-41]ATP39436.1 glycosyl transferase family 2 [Solibacillus sp. R5-41]
MERVLVSIHCTTYNHEKYIADAIESFLMQKTIFKFEILIHDDASTDRTADIIRDYEKLYPELIKPIYQTENQHSKGRSISRIILKRTQGKYIALCEGDDYWTDPYKLQKQLDYMEKHPECSLCVHGGYIVNASEKKMISKHRISKRNKLFTVEEVIIGGGALFLTNSMFYPTKYEEIRPAFFEIAPVGDYPTAINLSLLGTVYYIDESMSAYRTGVSNSWTARNASIKKKTEHYYEIAAMLDEINQYTNGKYKSTIDHRKYQNQVFLLLEQRKFKEAKSAKNKEYYLSLGYKQRFVIFLNQYCPTILQLMIFAKRRWSKWEIR